ncbi:unnamed protein product [Orchesella dallaii]|uniref:Secreted protein n=1 Tax=Orchesella dallaii TaxID=48710 RepID=A0ABP1Q5C1_9HEXA
MKWPGTSFVLLTVVFGILLFDIEFANGIKCYTCVNCDGKETGRTCGQHIVNPTSSAQSLGLGTERKFGDPPPGFEDPPPRFGNPPPGFLPDVVESDRCSKSEDEDGIVSKYCDHKANEANHKKLGFKCNEFGKGLKCHTCDDCGSIKGQVKECVNIGFKSIIIPRLGSGQQGSLRPPQPGSVSGEQGSRPTPQPGLEPGKSEVEPGFGSGHSELSAEGPGGAAGNI